MTANQSTEAADAAETRSAVSVASVDWSGVA